MTAACSGPASAQIFNPQSLDSLAEVKALSASIESQLAACRPVHVKFEAGTYENVRLMIDDRGRPDGCDAKVVVEGVGAAPGAIFVGHQQPKFIDIITNDSRFPGVIRNLELRDYQNGITATRTDARRGTRATKSRTSPSGANDRRPGLQIQNVVFKNVGDWDDKKGGGTGWSGISLIAVSGNILTANRFEGLGNKSESSLMHAIYLVNSTNNLIANNRFGAMDGAVIKFRDRANGNRVTGNVFRFEGQPVVQSWFCNRDVVGPKACPTSECPSSDNVFVNNRVARSGSKDRTRRGGGPTPITNPFVSYERQGALALVEEYYVGQANPKSCGPGRVAAFMRKDRGAAVDRR